METGVKIICIAEYTFRSAKGWEDRTFKVGEEFILKLMEL